MLIYLANNTDLITTVHVEFTFHELYCININYLLRKFIIILRIVN